MGVPGFFLWLNKKAKALNCKKQMIFDKISSDPADSCDKTTSTAKSSIDWLLIDTNCLIHPMCFKVLAEEDGDWSQLKLENKMINAVINYIEKLIDHVKPKKGIYIAIDGPAPLAKVKQQRQRRFKSYHDKVLFDNIKSKHKKEIKKFWNNSAITPGTIFMEKLHAKIVKWSRERDTSQVKIIYSSCKTPAEGEHKLLQFIRDNLTDKNIMSYVLYGLDADLIFLALASGNPNIYLLREAQEIDKKKSSNEFNFVSIDVMKDFIFEVVTDEINKELVDTSVVNLEIWLKYKENIIRDFIVICYFLGNDFLPHLSSLNIYTNGIGILIGKYAELIQEAFLSHNESNSGKTFNFFLVKKDGKYFNLNEELFFKLIYFLGSEESENLKNEFMTKKRKPRSSSTDPYDIEMHRIENLLFTINDPIKLGSDESNLWKKRFYTHYYPSLKDAPEKDYNGHIEDMVKSYLEGIKWILKYYFESCPDWRWFYKYDYAPFLEDISSFLENNDYSFKNVKFKKSNPIKAFQQLLMVLPPQSSYLLPSGMKGLTTNKNSKLVKAGLYPNKVEIDYLNKEKYWMGIPNLPNLDLKLITEVYEEEEKNMIEKSKLPGKVGDDLRNELRRNKVLANFKF